MIVLGPEDMHTDCVGHGHSREAIAEPYERRVFSPEIGRQHGGQNGDQEKQ